MDQGASQGRSTRRRRERRSRYRSPTGCRARRCRSPAVTILCPRSRESPARAGRTARPSASAETSAPSSQHNSAPSAGTWSTFAPLTGALGPISLFTAWAAARPGPAVRPDSVSCKPPVALSPCKRSSPARRCACRLHQLITCGNRWSAVLRDAAGFRWHRIGDVGGQFGCAPRGAEPEHVDRCHLRHAAGLGIKRSRRDPD